MNKQQISIWATFNPNHKETMMDELRKLIASWRDLATSWREDSLPMTPAYVAQGLADQLERALEGVDEPEPERSLADPIDVQPIQLQPGVQIKSGHRRIMGYIAVGFSVVIALIVVMILELHWIRMALQ